MMDEERRHVRRQLNQADVKQLHPPDDENALIQKLVGQYLASSNFLWCSILACVTHMKTLAYCPHPPIF
jgi:hypothetical protein